jgi:hypothetical protein
MGIVDRREKKGSGFFFERKTKKTRKQIRSSYCTVISELTSFM